MSESARKLHNQLIATIQNVSAREFWATNFDGILDVEVSTFLKVMDGLIKYRKKDTLDKAPIFEATIELYFCQKGKEDQKNYVTFSLYKRFFENDENKNESVETLMKKIVHMDSSSDQDNALEVNNKIFTENQTGDEAIKFWNEQIKAYKIETEEFKNKILDFPKKNMWNENDKRTIIEKLDEEFPSKEIKTQDYAKFFKNKDILDTFAGIVKDSHIGTPSSDEQVPQIHWDLSKKGTGIISRDQKSFLINDNNFQYIYSKELFEKGIHYVEVQLKQIVSGEVFVGVCTPDYEHEANMRPRNDDDLWVVGSQNFCKSSSQLLDTKKIEARQEMIFGILMNFEAKKLDIYVDNKKLLQADISKSLFVVVSAHNKFKYNDGVLLTNSYYREYQNISEFEHYFRDDIVSTQFQYTSGSFIESGGVEEDIFWDDNKNKKGNNLRVRNSRKTLETSGDETRFVGISETVFERREGVCNVHYIELNLVNFDGYIGIARNHEDAISDYNNDVSENKDMVWALGKSTKCNRSLGKIHTPFNDSIDIDNGYLGLLIDFTDEKCPTLTYVMEKGSVIAFKEFPLSVKLFVCLTEKTEVHITSYRNREGNYTSLLRQKPIFQTFNFKETEGREDLYFGNKRRRIVKKKKGHRNFITKVMKGSDKFYLRIRTKTSHNKFYFGVASHKFHAFTSDLENYPNNPAKVDGLVINGSKKHFSAEKNENLFTFEPGQEEEFIISVFLHEGAMIIYKTGTDQFFYTLFRRLAGFSEKDGVRFVVSMTEEGDYCEILDFFANPDDNFIFKPSSNKDAIIEKNTLSLTSSSPSVFLSHNIFLENKVYDFDQQYLFFIQTKSKDPSSVNVGFKGTQDITFHCGDTENDSMFLYFCPKKSKTIQSFKKKLETLQLSKKDIIVNFFVEPKNEGDKVKVLMTNLNNRFHTRVRVNTEDTVDVQGNKVVLKVCKEGCSVYAFPYTPLPGIKTLFILKFHGVKKHGILSLKSKFTLGFTSNKLKDKVNGIYESLSHECTNHSESIFVGVLLDCDNRCFHIISSKVKKTDKLIFNDKIDMKDLKLTLGAAGLDAEVYLDQTYFTFLDEKAIHEKFKTFYKNSGNASKTGENDDPLCQDYIFLK